MKSLAKLKSEKGICSTLSLNNILWECVGRYESIEKKRRKILN